MSDNKDRTSAGVPWSEVPEFARHHVRSRKLRMLLTHRKLLQSKAIAIENDLRH